MNRNSTTTSSSTERPETSEHINTQDTVRGTSSHVTTTFRRNNRQQTCRHSKRSVDDKTSNENPEQTTNESIKRRRAHNDNVVVRTQHNSEEVSLVTITELVRAYIVSGALGASGQGNYGGVTCVSQSSCLTHMHIRWGLSVI